MRIYFNVCCLNRPFDNQTYDRIHLETESIVIILNKTFASNWEIISSEVVDFEIGKIPDPFRKKKVEIISSIFAEKILLNEEIILKAKSLEKIGIKPIDALHISCAIYAEVDVYLTTDDLLIKKYEEEKNHIPVRIVNPVEWLVEVI